ncbi:MAG: hypothetical protein ACYTGJ_09945 [Planctomycetota bacterium]|jgi:hypothetical protein
MKNRSKRSRALVALRALGVCLGLLIIASPAAAQTLPIPTTIEDFFQPGTQPGGVTDTVIAGTACSLCHAYFAAQNSPGDRWSTTIMAQAARDPLFHACLTIAEQDAQFVGDICLRCHTPSAWLSGNSTPTDGSALSGINDWDGVTCNLCHRLVDPDYIAGVSPAVDQQIINSTPAVPVSPGNAQYIVDPLDRRRGPYALGAGFGFHPWFQSPYHREAALCGNCHDVSNPAYVRIGDEYVLDTLGQPHPTHDKYDQFPVERTFSEWSQSSFAIAPVDMGGRFGGNTPAVSTCQDCHMPKTVASACSLGGVVRPDQALHDFAGAQTWVLDAINNLDTTGLIWDTPAYMDPVLLEQTKSRNIAMLEAASDLELMKEGTELRVRVINHSGHKLPSGYPEGRRIWVNVRYRDGAGTVIHEHGHYDFDTAILTTADTKVYEAKLGLSEAVAAQTGLPAGESFHFALNNVWIKDNRIPPRGFTNAGFASVQASPVGYTYPDGQFWDDTVYPIPNGAVEAEVRVYYQTASREYIQFLLDANTTNNRGQILYDQWLATGKGPPVIMDAQTIDLQNDDFSRGDCNRDGDLNIADAIFLLEELFSGGEASTCPSACDGNDDGGKDISDAVFILAYLVAGGPPPDAPFPGCAADPTLDPLICPLYTCP